MKYILLIPDGAADHPHPDLDGKTPLQAARLPELEWYVQRGRVGVVHTIPEGFPPGSDVGNMSLFGYDQRKYYTGRGPIEAVALGLPLNPRDVVFRCNLVTTDGERMVDYCSGHITTEEARALMETIDEKLGGRRFSFYPGVGYRHLMVWRDGTPEQKTVPPHDIVGQPLGPHLPTGDGEETLRQLLWDSLEILDGHEVNRKRRDEGKNPGNMIWLWGQGRAASYPLFSVRYGLTGVVVSAVDLVRGIGKLAGMEILQVPGVTGLLDTNFRGKAEYALEALNRHDLVVIHVEAPDEMGHRGDAEAKVEALQLIDKHIVATLRERLHKPGTAAPVMDYRLLVAPDHPTPLDIRTHTSDPVPFLIYDSREEAAGPRVPFDERAREEATLRVEEGYRLMDLLLERT